MTFGGSTKESFKFDVNGDWVTSFGDTNKDGIADLGGSNIAIPQGSANYRIRFNDSTLAYTVTLDNGGNSCTTVSVTFTVSNANTTFGQELYVVGNVNELGNWATSPDGKLTIQGSGANAPWSQTIQLPKLSPIQYKYLKYSAVGNVWESNQATPSGNREIKTQDYGQPSAVIPVNFKS